MNLSLAKSLIEKNIINDDTRVLVNYSSVNFSGHKIETTGEFFVTDTTLSPLEFHIASRSTGTKYKITPDRVLEIDGMKPERFAEIYNLDNEGNTLKVIKRGRKVAVNVWDDPTDFDEVKKAHNNDFSWLDNDAICDF